MMLPVGARIQRARRALYVTRVARHAGIRRVLAEIGVRGDREATREGARGFREALEQLGTTYIKLGQLLSSRPDLLPDVYIDELEKLVDHVPPVPFPEIERVLAEELESHLRAELDFVEEANNTEIIRRVLSDYEDLVVPEVIHPYVTEKVL